MTPNKADLISVSAVKTESWGFWRFSFSKPIMSIYMITRHACVCSLLEVRGCGVPVDLTRYNWRVHCGGVSYQRQSNKSTSLDQPHSWVQMLGAGRGDRGWVIGRL